MEIYNKGIAGTLESSDAMITVEPNESGIELYVDSVVMNVYGRQIKELILKTLATLEVAKAKVTVIDKGALECTLKARLECAVYRSCDASRKISHGRISENDSSSTTYKNRLRRTMMFMNAQNPGY